MGALKFLALALVLGSAFCPHLAGQQHPRHPTSVPDLFNQEALASDPAGIHKYSEDLIGLLVPPGVSKETRSEVIVALADRLAGAEQSARSAQGRFVSEANVVRAFNELMAKVGAPSSLRTDEASMRRFREHAVAIKAFPALYTADRNGTNCNPGEAIFLLYLLISDDGVLYEGNLDSNQILATSDFQQDGNRGSFAGGIEPVGSSASRLLFSYSLRHNRNATIALFNNLTATLCY